MPTHIVIIGGGPGGYVAAIRAAQLGAQVTLVERGKIGGTCLNVGCIPTKCLLHSAGLLAQVRGQAGKIGVVVEGARVDFAQVLAYKDRVSTRLRKGVESLLRQSNVRVIAGEAAFTGPKALRVTTADGIETLAPDRIIIATGSLNAVPPIPGIEGNPRCIDSTGALSLEAPPQSMVIIGGGVIGTELASAYADFGTQVTIVEMMSSILPVMDRELTAIGAKHLAKQGVRILTGTTVESVKNGLVRCKSASGETVELSADVILTAVGRRANTAALDLAAAGIATERGYVLTDEHMQTSVPSVYAIGDCVQGVAQLAHAASAMGEVAAEHALGHPAAYDQATCPSCVYIAPEFAGVGLTEQQAVERGVAHVVGRFPLAANGKSYILNGGEGMVKVIASEDGSKLLGLHIIGPRATDLIHEGALAIALGATLSDLAATIHAHPTVAEAIREAALAADKRAIHMPNK